MDGGQWLTVKQYAAAQHITTQAVYKQLATSLQPYTKRENGRTYIHSDALTAQTLQPDLQPDATAVGNQFATSLQPALDVMRDLIDKQAAELDTVRAQLDAARRDAAAAQQAAAAAAAQLDAERRRADDLSGQLHAALDAVTAAQQHAETLAAALTRAQALHAGTIRGQLEADAGDDKRVGDGERVVVTMPEQSAPKPQTAAPKPAGADRRAQRSGKRSGQPAQRSDIITKLSRLFRR